MIIKVTSQAVDLQLPSDLKGVHKPTQNTTLRCRHAPVNGLTYWRAWGDRRMIKEPMPPEPFADHGHDVRMRGFVRRSTVEQALQWLDSCLPPFRVERVPLLEAHKRVLATAVISGVNVPGFARGMMDGFAVQANDTSGSSTYNRLPLEVIGQSLPGQSFGGDVAQGQAVRIMTGAPMPNGADAVVPVEHVDIQQDRILVHAEVPPGKHVGLPGEDIVAGTNVLPAARRLRPQDIGVLSSIGVANVDVLRKPHVRIVATGNELLPPGSVANDYQIADANSPMLAALVERDGGVVDYAGIVSDDRSLILEALQVDADIVITSGGSSVGQEDHVPTLVAEYGELAIHGIAMRPSSPAGLGRMGDRLVFLLPGNPVSCLCAYDFFAGRAIRAMGGLSTDWPYVKQRLPLRRKLVSMVGRVDYARVSVVDGQVEPIAVSGASILSSTTRADGFVVIPADSEGYAANTNVEFYLYD